MVNVVIVSDAKSVRQGFFSFFKDLKKVNNLYIKTVSYKSIFKKINNTLLECDGTIYLIFDFYHLTEHSGGKDKANTSILEKAKFEDVILNLLINNKIKSKIEGIIVFAQNTIEPSIFYDEFEKINIFFKKNKIENAYIIETSHIFSRIPEKKVYEKHGSEFILGERIDLEDYGKLIGSIVNSLIYKNTKPNSKAEELQYLHKNSLIFNEYISNLNSNFFKKDFPLATFSFVVKEINEYLIDWPFKGYYELQNAYIKNNIDKIFKIDFKPDNEYLEGCNFYYLKYCINNFLRPIKLQRIGAYFDKKCNEKGRLIDVFNEGRWNPEFKEELFKDWLNILATSIFFHADLLKWKEWGVLPTQECNKQSSVNCENCEYNKIEIFWFMHKSKSIEDNNLHGLFTYTFYDTNKEIDDHEIVGKGKSLYNIRRPLVETKAKETLFPYLFSTLNKNATRAAISQVMARNMSHNIGSHVLSNMITIKAVRDKYKNKSQYNSLFNDLYGDDNNKKNTINNSNYLIANFISYLRTRMDFLADIATGEPSMEVTRLLVRDVIGDLDKNRIFLNRISGVTDFKFSIAVRDCRNCKNEECATIDCRCDGKQKDIPISIPNGIMGYHSLYIIIENIIRNTAKHQGKTKIKEQTYSNERKNSSITFTLEIRTSKIDKTLYEVLIYDDIPIKGALKLDIDDKKFYKESTGEDFNNEFNNKLDWLVFQQNCRLNGSVINSQTSRLREGAWGLIEMDASAAYLRKESPESIDDDKYNLQVLENASRTDFSKINLNILKAVKKNDYLAYRFHIMKPKELLVVDEKGDLFDELYKNGKLVTLRENGIWVLNKNENQGEKDACFDIDEVYPHSFLLVIAGENFSENDYLYTKVKVKEKNREVEKNLFRGNLPTRIIVCGDNRNATNNSPWISYIDKICYLIEELLKADIHKLIRQIPNCESSLEQQTIMDLIWQNWLENKVRIHNIKIKSNGVPLARRLIKYFFGNNLNLTNNSDFSLYFDHHGEEKKDWSIENIKEEYDYYISFPSSVKDFVTNAELDDHNGAPNLSFDKINLAIIADSIFSKHLIIDERIQSAWEVEHSMSQKKQQDLYECCGLFSPKKEDGIDLNKQIFDQKDYKKELLKLINVLDNTSKLKGLDYIVIHLGIIEKALTASGYQKRKEDVLDFILALQDKLQNKTRIVITSGRGKPDNLPKQVPFIAFSTLSQYTIETPFKPFLNQIIQIARTFKS